MREIAIRGFINEKFNTTFGKGLFRRAVYNGSVELHGPNQKYLVDYYSYPEWEAQAKSDSQIAAIHHLINSGVTEDKDMLFSWLVHYDPLTKSKERAEGYSVYSPNSRELFIKIDDPANQTQDEWTLDVHSCKSTGSNKPVFIAANVDLT